MRKRFLALVMALVVSSSPGVVHAADRQHLSPDPGSDTAQGIVPTDFTVEEAETIPTGKPTDFSGLTISLPVRADLELNNDETAYSVEDYVEIKGDLSYKKYITATATAEYTSPDGKVKKTPTVNHESVDFKWSASQVLAAKDTADHRAFDISIPSKEVEGYAGTWDGHIDFTFNIKDIGEINASAFIKSRPESGRPDYRIQFTGRVNIHDEGIDINSNKKILSLTFNKPVRFDYCGSLTCIAGDGTNTLQLSCDYYLNHTASLNFGDIVVLSVDGSLDLEVLNAELIIEPSFI